MGETLRLKSGALASITVLIVAECGGGAVTTTVPATIPDPQITFLEDAFVVQMWEKQSTIGEFTWLVTATNATLTDLLHEACASFDEGISISDQTAAFIKAQGERATTRDPDREMAGYFFDAASATCEALAT